MSKRKLMVQIDKKTDTAYVSLGMGEPCACEEFDDAILIERGIFSNLIGGFRVLDFSKYRKGAVRLNRLKDIFRALRVENAHVAKALRTREEILESALNSLDRDLDALAAQR